MTSVLANVRTHFPQSGMPNEPRFQYADLPSRSINSSSSSSLAVNNLSSTASSSSTLALAAATPATSTMSSAPTSSDTPNLSQQSAFPSSASTSLPSTLYSAATIPSAPALDSVFSAYAPSNSIASLSASCPPDGPSFSNTAFDADLAAAAAFAPLFASGGSLSLDGASGPLSFPVLPASLLDEAPEYEYSVHTRLNVFESSDYGSTLPTFTFAEDGTPLLDDTTQYGLWSTDLDVDADQPATSSLLGYPDDALSFLDTNGLQTQPRSAVQLGSSSRPNDFFGVSPESFIAPRNTFALASASGVGGPHQGHDISAMAQLPDPSAAIAVENAPSVLHPGPALSQLQQRLSSQLGSNADEMYESQAGPSRGLHRSRDAPVSANTPYARARPGLHGHRSYHNLGAAAGFSSPQNEADLRRLSTPGGVAGGAGPPQAPGRDPVVPSQNVGRARLMSWQNDNAYDAGPDWHSNGFADPGLAVSGDHGFGVRGSHPSSESMAATGMSGHPAAMMPPSRSYSFGVQQSSSGFVPQSGIHPHQNDMINALGDAMDARIDADGIAKCPYPNCNKTFAKNRSYNLKAHLRSHSQLKPFACSVCPRAFSRKHDLERHSRVHSGDKPYICEICNKGFPRSDALRRHWRVEKECGDKAAALEASQSLSGMMDDGGYDERSPEQQDHQAYLQAHQQHHQQQQQGGGPSGMYDPQHQQIQMHQQQRPQQPYGQPMQQQQQQQQQYSIQQQQRAWAEQQQQPLRR